MRKYILSAAIMAVTLPMATPAIADDAYVSADISFDASTQSEIVSSRTYTVSAEGKRRDSRDDVYESALQMAAKKTLRLNYDWFRVLDKETERETVRTERFPSRASAGFERRPVKTCGLLGCTTRYERDYRAELQSDFPQRSDTYYEVTLDFEMGRGPVTDGGRVYDAGNVRRTR